MQSSGKNFKTLHDNLIYKEKDKKCEKSEWGTKEISKIMPQLLGVSKAVLDYVIFCHQEENLWPFGDNTTLKNIFDELFDTTKYIINLN